MDRFELGSHAGGERSIVVVGAGGHAKVIIESLRLAGWNVVGCTDSDATPRLCAGAPVIGNDDKLGELLGDGVSCAFCAIGDNALRERIGRRLLSLGFEMPAVLGPGTTVAPSVSVGAGVAILPGAVVNSEAVLRDFAIINSNANVDHDCLIGCAAHIGPGASLAGNVQVGDRTFLATGSAVIPGTEIGADTIVGAGSVVVRNLPPEVLAYGNPAKLRRPI